MRCLRDVSIAALILLLTSTTSFAQATAQLGGRITDESGGVLPGVTVTVVQTDTGLTRTSVTDDKGTYVIPNLPTGPYRLEASLQGFRTHAQTGIVLQVGATPTINVVLAVGNLAGDGVGRRRRAARRRRERRHQRCRRERAHRRAAAAGPQRHRPDRAGRRRRADGHAPTAAACRAASASRWPAGCRSASPTCSTARCTTTRRTTPNLPLPFPDALQEFSVATSGLSAQNGMHSAASVNAVTKSGTNSFHGNAFEFLRDHRFNATNPFAAIGPATASAWTMG